MRREKTITEQEKRSKKWVWNWLASWLMFGFFFLLLWNNGLEALALIFGCGAVVIFIAGFVKAALSS